MERSSSLGICSRLVEDRDLNPGRRTLYCVVTVMIIRKNLQRCKKMVLYENGRIIKQYTHSGCN